MPGPAPDPYALRRDRSSDAGFRRISSAPRSEPAPAWPLIRPSIRELELWAEMWAKPQARLWLTQDFEVALLVRRMAEAEQPDAPVSLGVLVRQMMSSLLLTLPAMLSARVTFAEPADVPSTPRTPHRQSASQRLRSRSRDASSVGVASLDDRRGNYGGLTASERRHLRDRARPSEGSSDD
jgi:hypothetical protein